MKTLDEVDDLLRKCKLPKLAQQAENHNISIPQEDIAKVWLIP